MAPRQSQSNSALAERPISPLGVIAPPPIHVETPVFEGSLATLFRMTRDHQVDLLGVPLYPICEAYFAYMIASDPLNLDEAAAALTALAYLLERKAWMLLPVPEPEPEFEGDMEAIEPTSQEFQGVIQALSVWHEERSRLFFRAKDMGPDPYELPFVMSDITPTDLARAFERLLRRAHPEPMDSPARARRSLAEQMKAVLLAVSHEWKTLERLVPEPFSREEAVYWFLSLLELIRLRQVNARLEGDDVEFARA